MSLKKDRKRMRSLVYLTERIKELHSFTIEGALENGVDPSVADEILKFKLLEMFVAIDRVEQCGGAGDIYNVFASIDKQHTKSAVHAAPSNQEKS